MLRPWLFGLGLSLGLPLSACVEVFPPAEASSSGEIKSTAAVVDRCTMADPDGEMSRQALAKLQHIAPGNSSIAIHNLTGYPRCYIGFTEYWPVEGDASTWISINFDSNGDYVGYGFSFQN